MRCQIELLSILTTNKSSHMGAISHNVFIGLISSCDHCSGYKLYIRKHLIITQDH